MQVGERGRQRKRDHGRHDQRRAEREHEREQHAHDEQRSFEQVVEHRLQRGVDELGAIVKGAYFDALRQHGVVQLADALAQRIEHQRRIFAAPHQHDALDGVLVLAARDHALARRVAFVHLRDVLNRDRNALVIADANVLDVVEAVEDADAPDHEHLGAALDVAAGRVGARLAERAGHVAERDAERCHLRRVGLHVHFALQAAVRHHVRHALHLEQAGAHHPILQGAQGHGVSVFGAQRIPENLADRRRHRAERWTDAVG